MSNYTETSVIVKHRNHSTLEKLKLQKKETTIKYMGYIHDNGSNFGDSDEEESQTSVKKLENSHSDIRGSFDSIGSMN
jgi:hypothetical protein